MIFGPVPVAEAEGAILAHSLPLGKARLKKGATLTDDDIARLRDHDYTEITVARLEPGDLGEDEAAARIAEALVPEGTAHLRRGRAATGRVNVHATTPGVLGLDVARIEALNRVHPMITLATLPAFARAADRAMLATVKIISYGVPEAAVIEAARLARDAFRLHPVRLRTATLIVTDTGNGAGKGERAVAQRLEALGMTLAATRLVPHAIAPLAEAIAADGADLTLVLTGSATSDPHDTAPEALRRAGGTVTRFGLPVDPGNLLFLGHLGARPVIGLPGCARSPALNGADWVLERTVCGLPPDAAQIAAMGVGGLLKESPRRPHPRAKADG